MAQINRWKCDICGQEFGEGDGGYKNRVAVDIDIFMDKYVDSRQFCFDDTCMNCRFKLVDALDKTLEKIIQ